MFWVMFFALPIPAFQEAANTSPFMSCKGRAEALFELKQQWKNEGGPDRFVERIKRDSIGNDPSFSLDVFVFLLSRQMLRTDEEELGIAKRLANELLSDEKLVRLFCDTYLYVPHSFDPGHSEIEFRVPVDLWAANLEEAKHDHGAWYDRYYVQGKKDSLDSLTGPDADLINMMLFWELAGRPIEFGPKSRREVRNWQSKLLDWWGKNEKKLVFDQKKRRLRLGTDVELLAQRTSFERAHAEYDAWKTKNLPPDVDHVFGQDRWPPGHIPNTPIIIPLLRSKLAPERLTKW